MARDIHCVKDTILSIAKRLAVLSVEASQEAAAAGKAYAANMVSGRKQADETEAERAE